MLQRDGPAASEEAKPPRQSPGGAAAAKELHTHLCDGTDWACRSYFILYFFKKDFI